MGPAENIVELDNTFSEKSSGCEKSLEAYTNLAKKKGRPPKNKDENNFCDTESFYQHTPETHTTVKNETRI